MKCVNWERVAVVNVAAVLISLLFSLLLVLAFTMCRAPKPLSVDEMNAREQERLAKEAARMEPTR